MDSFDGKIRQVGSSFGVLIPKEIVAQGKLKKGQMVRVAILKKDLSMLDKAFGSMKNLPPFERDRDDREF